MEKLFRLGDVIGFTGRGATAIYADIKDGLFPSPVRLGRGTAVRWRQSDLTAWAAALPQGVDSSISAAANERVRSRNRAVA